MKAAGSSPGQFCATSCDETQTATESASRATELRLNQLNHPLIFTSTLLAKYRKSIESDPIDPIDPDPIDPDLIDPDLIDPDPIDPDPIDPATLLILY